MENTSKYKFTIVLFLSVLHNVLFYNEFLGINVFIYSTILIGMLCFFNPLSFRTRNVLLTLAGTLLSAMLVVIHGSDVAKFSHFASLFVLVGFIHTPQIRSIFFSLFAMMETICQIHRSIRKPKIETQATKRNNTIYRITRLAVFPLLFLIIFYWIYATANPVFAQLSSNFWSVIGDSIADIFSSFSFGRLFFSILGFSIAVIAMYKPIVQGVLGIELKLTDRLFRVTKHFDKYSREPVNFKTFSLVNEYHSALILIGLVNILLLIVNIIDINWIWFNFDVKSVGNLSQFVHEGTYLLIVSILLSMGIIEYFFRKNLNFYAKNKSLKALCYLWIAQNIIMVISVAARNYHYIAEHGLAYKRIGVIFFLALTIFGLITQAYKINRTCSGYFMVRVNSWAVYVMMLIIASFNWDIIIAEHNISHPLSANIDTKFLLSLSSKTLPILARNKALFEKNYPIDTADLNGEEVRVLADNFIKDVNDRASIDYKIHVFINNYKCRNWLEWNYADACAYEQLKK